MPAIANIVINDGLPTPVAHTFTPTDATTALATWHERSTGIAIGYSKITLATKPNGNVNQVSLKVEVPTLETISGDAGGYTPAPRVAYTTMASVELKLPVRCTEQERENIRLYVNQMMVNAFVTAAVEKLERVY